MPVFNGLTSTELSKIISCASVRHWDDGASIFAAGDPPRRIFLLLDGIVRVVRPQINGTQIVPFHIPAGEFFGVAIVLGFNTYPATAVAASRCMTLSWLSELWPGLTSEFPVLQNGVGRNIGWRMGALLEHIEGLTNRSVEQRLAAALLLYDDRIKQTGTTGEHLPMKLSRSTLAEMTGSTLYTVCRIMSAWRTRSFIGGSRGRVTILSKGDLVSIRDSPH